MSTSVDKSEIDAYYPVVQVVVILSATRIKRLRAKLGMTLERFAFHIGVSRAAVSYWENGDRVPTARNQSALNSLAKRYKIDLQGGD